VLSDEHFTMDGTLVEAWASRKSFWRKDQGPAQPPDDPGNPTVNFHGERRRNATHQSTTDPEAKEAKLCYSANALMENRHGLLIEFGVAPADGYAERNSARTMLETALPGSRRITLGADKGYDTRELVASCSALKLTPHIARNEDRAGGSAIDCRTARHAGYAVSPKGAQAGRRDLRLDENRRRPAAYPLPRLRPHPVACLPGGCRLQPAPHRQAQPGSRVNQNHKRLSR
jgi:hypothetical protein